MSWVSNMVHPKSTSTQTAQMAAAQAAQASQTQASAQAGLTNPHKPSHSVSKHNRAFVQKFGFGDLTNDQITQFRHKTAVILKAMKQVPSAPTRDVMELIKLAGKNPKLRSNLEGLYHLVKEQGSHLNAGVLSEIIGLMKKHPGLNLSNPASRAGALALVTTNAYRTSKFVYHNAAAIIAEVGRHSLSPANAKKAAEQMANYAKQMPVAYGVLKLADHQLAQIGDDESGPIRARDGHLFAIHLKKIASSKDPAKAAKKALSEVLSTAKARTASVKQVTIKKYQRVLMRSGVSEAKAAKAAGYIYALGGPASPLARTVINAMAARPMNKYVHSKEQAQGLAKTLKKQMLAATSGFQPMRWNSSHIGRFIVPSDKIHTPKAAALTQLAMKYGDVISIASESMGTIDTISEVIGAEAFPVLGPVVSIVGSIIGGVLTMSTMGYLMKKAEAVERGIYGYRGFWGAIQAVQNSEHGPKVSQAQARYGQRQDSHNVQYTPAARAAFDKNFDRTYTALMKIPKKQRYALVDAMKWLMSENVYPNPDDNKTDREDRAARSILLPNDQPS